jgi:DNA invertase Pin-like site-specific DNA recombinase
MASMTEMTVREAREWLIEWATVVADRDVRVRSAFISGVTKSEISRLTGIARTTVDRILDSAGDGPATDREATP